MLLDKKDTRQRIRNAKHLDAEELEQIVDSVWEAQERMERAEARLRTIDKAANEAIMALIEIAMKTKERDLSRLKGVLEWYRGLVDEKEVEE